MLWVILNCLKAEAEELLAEDWAGFREGTVEWILTVGSSLRNIYTSMGPVPQLHWFSESLWQSVAWWPLACPQRQGRARSSDPGPLWTLQQCSFPQQPTGRTVPNSWHKAGVPALPCTIQPVPGKIMQKTLQDPPPSIPPSPLDGDDLSTHVDGCQQNSLEGDFFFCPQVPLTTAKVEGLRWSEVMQDT